MKKSGQLMVLLAIFAFTLAGGMLAYTYLEGWRLLDSAYFVLVTMTTIGYGDFTPVTDAGKLFTIFFAFFGVAFVFYFITWIAGSIFQKHVERGVEKFKRQVRGEEEAKREIEEALDKKLALKAKRRSRKVAKKKR